MEAAQREAIIEYSRKTIVQLGVKAFRMDDVAQATRTSKRTLYETFGDKDELMFLAIREHFEAFDKNNAESAKGASNILIAMLIVMEEFRKHAEVNWSIVNSLKRFYPKVFQKLINDKADIKRKFFADAIKMGIDHGYIVNGINIPLTMNMFSYIAIGISENNEMIDIPKDINAHDAFIEVLITYIRGISTIKGIKVIDEYIQEKYYKQQ